MSQHKLYCALNPDRKIRINGMLGKKGGNQFTKKPGSKHSLKTKEKISESSKNQIWTDERRKHISNVAKLRGLGGHTSKKKMYFQKKSGEIVYLQSSYEVKMAEILEKLSIEWSRPDPFTWIDCKGESHRYYPDFKIGNIYLDTKNDYLIVKDAAKIKAVKDQNGIELLVVSKNQITEEFIVALKALW